MRDSAVSIPAAERTTATWRPWAAATAVERILGEAGIEASDVGYLVHGTTVATNAIIEGKLAPTGFITTEGFRDMLEIGQLVHGTTVATNAIIEGKLAPTGFLTTEEFRDMLEIQRQIRPRGSLYDLLFEKPRPLAPRYLCFGIPERLDAAGTVLTPLDEQAVAFGGTGPARANRLAAELDIPTVLVPMSPGTTSAMGLLVTDIKHDYSATLIQRADRLDAELVNRRYREMEARGEKALLAEGMGHASIGYERQADMRYVGQSYELPIPFGDGKVEDTLEGMLQDFHKEHERAYGFAAPGEPVEFVTLRLTAVGNNAKPRLRELPASGGGVTAARRTVRQVYFAESGGFVDCPSFDRYRLPAGGVIEGPAIVEEMDSTTVIHPGFRGEVDRYGNLLIRTA